MKIFKGYRYLIYFVVCGILIFGPYANYNKQNNYYKGIIDNFIGCGPVAHRLQGGLDLVNFESRLVAVITKEEYNNNNGHTLIEINSKNGWILYDSFLGIIFMKNDKILNLVETCKAVQLDDFDLNIVGSYQLPKKIFDVELDEWIKRVYQVPLIYDDERFYTYDRETVERNKLNRYLYLTEEEWLDKFYEKY